MGLNGNINLLGGFNPSEKYESQLGKIKHVPNHQPVTV
jgi:hypothetical protein